MQQEHLKESQLAFFHATRQVGFLNTL